MMCFRDMSFCSSSHICGNYTCLRNFSKTCRSDAEAWWNPTGDPEKKDGAPIAMMDYKTGCEIFIEKDLTDAKS